MKELDYSKKLTYNDCVTMPNGWGRIAWYSYERFCKNAKEEVPPAFNVLMVAAIQTVFSKNRELLDYAVEFVGSNMKEADVLSITGSVLCAIGKMDEGLDRMRRAVDLDPCQKNIIVLVGELDERINGDEKRNLCNRILAEDPNDVDAIRGLASVFLHEGKLKDAEEYLLRALEIAPKDSRLHEAYGEVLFRTKRYRQALKESRKAIKLGFGVPSFYLLQQVALCHANLGHAKRTARAVKAIIKTAQRKGFDAKSPEIQKLIDFIEDKLKE